MMFLARHVLLATILALVSPWVMAQAFPSKPLRIIVPFPAGGPVDGLGRALGRALSDSLGQPVIVENKPGANTMIGGEFVAKADPDGYTYLLATDATVSISPFVYAKMSYDPQADLVPVSVLTHVPEYLFVGTHVPANTLQEFIAHVKSRPGQLNYGSYGVGSSGHLEFEALKMATGIDVTHIPFKGAAEVYPAMLAGRIDAAISSVVLPLPHVRAGKIKAIVVMGPQRTSVLPNVPTFKESGVPGFEANPWFGLLAPAKTPTAILDRMTAEVSRIVGSQDFRERSIDAVGLAPAPLGRGYFSDLLKSDLEKYRQYVKNANIKPE